MTHTGFDVGARSEQLSIILPTVRFDALAKQIISTLAAIGSNDVKVLIGDNSENEDKWRFLRNAEAANSNVRAFCRPKNVGEAENFRLLFDQTHDEYLCFVSDDDICSVDYFTAGLATLREDPDCAVASGLMLVLATNGGDNTNLVAASSNLHASPSARVAAYQGYNTIIWSVFRRRFAQSFFDYSNDRPLIAPYDDQIFANAMLAQGTYRIRMDKPLYVWMNTNWADPVTAWSRSAAFYTRAGLPEEFQLLHFMSWAVEAAHFFQSRYRPVTLDADEATAIAKILYDRLFQTQFRAVVADNLDRLDALFRHSPTGGKALVALLTVPCDSIYWILDQYVAILDAFNPDLGQRYRTFVDASF